MKVLYSDQALADLDAISEYYRSVASSTLASTIEKRLRMSIRLIAEWPKRAPRVANRDFRAAVVHRLPYRIFYHVRGDTIYILHIRHTSRRPWAGADE